MSRPNMMGFKPVKKIPARVRKGASIYDPVIDAVLKSGQTYGIDTKDCRRAYSLAATIRQAVRKRDLSDRISVIVRYSCVYVTQSEHEEEEEMMTDD